jgi:hypothetical protein
MIHFRFGALLVEHLLNKNVRLKISDRYLGAPRIGYRYSIGHWMVILLGWYGWWIRLLSSVPLQYAIIEPFLGEPLLNPAHFCIFLSVIDLLSNLSNFFFV